MPRETPGKTLLDGLRHPLFLLIVGSVIGSFLIPSISERSGRKRALQEARLRKAVDIVDNNTRTVSQLNALKTRLSMFHADNMRLKPSAEKLRQLQEKLAEDMNSRYLDFDKLGWWWYRDLNDEAVILEIVPPSGSDRLRGDVNAYGDNILKTVTALNEFWHRCVAADYDFNDSSINAVENKVAADWQVLGNQRNDIVNNLVADFTKPPAQ